jgi:hypothetical protein
VLLSFGLAFLAQLPAVRMASGSAPARVTTEFRSLLLDPALNGARSEQISVFGYPAGVMLKALPDGALETEYAGQPLVVDR